MATGTEALAEYNKQRGTEYATEAELGTALAKTALHDAWRAKLMNAAYEQAKIETAAI